MTRVWVDGLPAPQGSKRVGRHPGTGRAVLVESSKHVGPWRRAVVAAWQAAEVAMVSGPVSVELLFLLPRPKGHYGTGRNAGRVRPSAPAVPGVKPDVDKLVRATLDGLSTAGAFEDDARVVDLVAWKRYADGARVGCWVRVSPSLECVLQ